MERKPTSFSSVWCERGILIIKQNKTFSFGVLCG